MLYLIYPHNAQVDSSCVNAQGHSLVDLELSGEDNLFAELLIKIRRTVMIRNLRKHFDLLVTVVQ